MIPQKVIDFFFSEEYERFISDLGSFLGLNWESEQMPQLINFANELLKTNKKGEELEKDLRRWLDFIDENKRNEFLIYIEEKWRGKIDELWQEEVEEEREEETYEEKERRYRELMKEILMLEKEETSRVEGEQEERTEEKEVIVLEPKERKSVSVSWEPPKKEESELPEGTIVITKKEEEKTDKDENLLDLSNL